MSGKAGDEHDCVSARHVVWISAVIVPNGEWWMVNGGNTMPKVHNCLLEFEVCSIVPIKNATFSEHILRKKNKKEIRK